MDNENINNKITYNGKLGDIIYILFKNGMANLLTIGIYSFWGRVNIREYIAENASIHRFSFKYTGTGGELFKGFLYTFPFFKIINFILLKLEFLFYKDDIDHINQIIYEIIYLFFPIGDLALTLDKIFEYIFSSFILYLNPDLYKNLISKVYIRLPTVNENLFLFYGIYYVIFTLGSISALKYRISRITFKDISANIKISEIKYTLYSTKYLFLNFISLGYLIPQNDINLRKYIINNLHYGSNIFKFVEKKHVLNRVNIITLLLTIPTLGISRFWYKAAFTRHIYDCVELNNIKFKNTQTGKGIMWLFISNSIMLVTTLYMAQAFVQHRILKYFSNNLEIKGDLEELNFSKSEEKEDNLKKHGESINYFLGSDNFLNLI